VINNLVTDPYSLTAHTNVSQKLL